MLKNNDQYYLSRCIEATEAVFNRGAGKDWATYDFEKLSDAIFERTQVRLSVTTLKRIWGKLKYNSAPTLTTLNALAQFTGHADWRAFTEAQPTSIVSDPDISKLPVTQKSYRRVFRAAGAGLLCLAGVYFFLSARRMHARYDPKQFEFSANKMITEGVPNSVIFNYSAKEKPDSLFIVQTWDISRKTLVSPDKHEHSAIYYYPGFFRTKLIADEQVMKTHDLWITSGGWLCMMDNDPMPVYFKKEDCRKQDYISVDKSMLEAYRRPSEKRQLRFFNQQDLSDLMNDNFTFETVLKNDIDDGTDNCRYTQVLIQCKDDIIIIPLAARTCVGNLNLYFCGAGAESKSADLSAFGCDLAQWTKLRVETVNKNATIYVNDKKAYSLTFPNDPTGIVGVQYRFGGPAAVKYATFTSGGRVYELN